MAAPASPIRGMVLFLLVFVTYVSPPRLNLGTFQGQASLPKTVDVRAEDVVLAGVLALWLVRPGFVRWRSPLKPLILVYLGWSIVATVFAISQDWVIPLRAIFYTAKEIEYFLFFAVGLLCVRNVGDLKAGIAGLAAGALVQGAYAVFQLATGQYTGTYAVGLLGEPSPHITAMCGCLSLCLGLVLFDPAKPRLAALSIACAVLGAAGIVGSISRTAVFSAGGAALVLLFLELPQRRGILPRWAPVALFVVTGLAVVVAYTVLISGEPGDRTASLVARRIDPLFGTSFADEGVQAYHQSRVVPVLEDYFKLFWASPILGNGKSITGHSEERFADAHNYYLRLAVEVGVVGLFLFMGMIFVVVRTSFRLYRHGHPRLVRIMGLLCLLFTVVVLVASLASDVFISPRIAELYWVLVGMTMGLERLNRFANPR